jgi:hypothetical protein
MQLSDYIDQEIVLLIPFIDAKVQQKVRLRGVEAGGIWVESQTLLNLLLNSISYASASKSLVFFFPYHEVRFGYVAIEGPALNEKAFGV